MADNKLKLIKKTTEELIGLLGFEVKISVDEDKENEAVVVQIETAEEGMLIGYHGQTLSSLQLLLGMMMTKKLGEWKRLIVNIGDYRQKREEILKRMAMNAAQKAHFSGQPVVFSDLSPFERRVIHTILTDHADVETYSEGEGRERKLIIRPRSLKSENS